MVQLNIEFRLLEARIEVSGLAAARELMENQIQILSGQLKAEADADLRKLAEQGVEWEDADVHRTVQERDYAIEHLYPRLFRAPFVLTLWAVYEAGVKEIARFIKTAKRIDLDIDELSGSDIRKKAKRYFDAVLQVPLEAEQADSGEIGKLYKLRNAFAHANGALRNLPPEVLRTVKSMIDEGHLEETLGYIVPTERYVARATDLVRKELASLIGRAINWHDTNA